MTAAHPLLLLSLPGHSLSVLCLLAGVCPLSPFSFQVLAVALATEHLNQAVLAPVHLPAVQGSWRHAALCWHRRTTYEANASDTYGMQQLHAPESSGPCQLLVGHWPLAAPVFCAASMFRCSLDSCSIGGCSCISSTPDRGISELLVACKLLHGATLGYRPLTDESRYT